MSKIVLALFVIVIVIACTSKGQQQEKPGSIQAPKTAAETQTQEYLATFEKDGVPILGAVEAALTKAKKENTIETWANAARLANSYANVVSLLDEHYMSKFEHDARSASETGRIKLQIKYMEESGAYGKADNQYKNVRNDCYLSIAELYLKQGSKASALSYAMTAVRLTGATGSITRGEALIKKIIEYK
jgi:hypothetical protein